MKYNLKWQQSMWSREECILSTFQKRGHTHSNIEYKQKYHYKINNQFDTFGKFHYLENKKEGMHHMKQYRIGYNIIRVNQHYQDYTHQAQKWPKIQSSKHLIVSQDLHHSQIIHQGQLVSEQCSGWHQGLAGQTSPQVQRSGINFLVATSNTLISQRKEHLGRWSSDIDLYKFKYYSNPVISYSSNREKGKGDRFRCTQNSQSGMKNKRQALNYCPKPGFHRLHNSIWDNFDPKYNCQCYSILNEVCISSNLLVY